MGDSHGDRNENGHESIQNSLTIQTEPSDESEAQELASETQVSSQSNCAPDCELDSNSSEQQSVSKADFALSSQGTLEEPLAKVVDVAIHDPQSKLQTPDMPSPNLLTKTLLPASHNCEQFDNGSNCENQPISLQSESVQTTVDNCNQRSPIPENLQFDAQTEHDGSNRMEFANSEEYKMAIELDPSDYIDCQESLSPSSNTQ